MEWIEGFLKKYNWLGVFDKVWDNISPYPEYFPPHTKYRQITVWTATEIRGFPRLILACFTIALGQTAGSHKLSAAPQRDSKIGIRCVRAITDFCLMAQYRSHTQQTKRFMNEYLQQFHNYRKIFAEFRACKSDHKEAAKVAEQIAEGQAQSTI